MEWVILVVYIIGIVIAYMITMLITDQKPSEWGGIGIHDDQVHLHVFCILWPFTLIIILPILIIGGVVVGMIKMMDRFYDFLKGGNDAIR
jgi:hypothetical protein